MPMRTDIDYGYGFKASKIKVKDVEKLKKLIHRIPEYEKDINDYFANKKIIDPTVRDYLGYMENYNGLAGLLETLICKEEGVVLYACNDDDGVCYLMYIPGYPWEFNHVDLSLTEDKLKTLFQKYVALLSDDPINIGYQRCEKCS